jgi:tRNA (adenine57-N1/adenine58-N1)-methyltransferase
MHGLLLIKPAKTALVDGVTRILADHEQWYLPDASRDFHCQIGVIPKDKLKPGAVTINGVEFLILPALYADRAKSIKRKAQIITRKDVGCITGHCGLTKDSIVVESGAGSGGSTVLFGALVRHVYSYEIEQESVTLVRENVARVGLSNVTVTHADFYAPEAIPTHEADVVLLDLPEPWRGVANAIRAVKLGGYVVAYTPSIIQAAKFTNTLPKELLHERTIEVIERQWKVRGDAVRPDSEGIGHTAFLTFTRKIRDVTL